MKGQRESQPCPHVTELARSDRKRRIESSNPVHVPQATRADLDPLGSAFPVDGDLLDVWLPLALGSHVRVANAVPKRWCFAADFTLGHDCTSPA